MIAAGDDASFWAELWPLLLTAALTLAVTAWVQFWLVPRVDVRRRRDDRWERDLLDLGELLSFEQPETASAYAHALWWKAALREPQFVEGSDPEKLAELQHEADQDVATHRLAYERMDNRVDWLIDRILSVDPNFAKGMNQFRHARISYTLATMKIGGLSYSSDPVTSEGVTDVQDEERRAVRALVVAVKALLGHPPPRPTLRTRVRRWRGRIKGWATRRSGKAAARKGETKNTDASSPTSPP